MINPILWLITEVISLYSWVVIIWAILGLLIHFDILNRSNQVVYKLDYVLTRLVEPALKIIRRAVPPIGGLDISPVILLIGLNFINYSIVYLFA